MAVTVCTGWHPQAYGEYAARFVETFDRHWPASVSLIAYTEEPVAMPRGECRSLWDIPGARAFYQRHHAIPAHKGLMPDGSYAWRQDAVRFFKQCVIPNAAADGLLDGEILIWLDADVVTFADVPLNWAEGMIRNADLCYLGRRKGSEIGFWAVRLNGRTRPFLFDLASLYTDDRIFDLPQTHSAFAFDHARAAAERKGMQSRDLTPGGRGHVWLSCRPLYGVCDHLKGNRKAKGHSPEHPLRWWEKKA